MTSKEENPSEQPVIQGCRAVGGSLEHTCIFIEVLRNIETGIIILDTGGSNVFFINNHAARILEFIKTPADFDSLSLFFANELEDITSGGKKSAKTVVNCDHRAFGYTLYSMEKEKNLVMVFIQDITDQSRLDAIDEASEMMNNISYLFSGIRHEIGNPINSMKMAMTVLNNGLSRFSEDDIRVYLKRMSDDIARMESLLKSFKNFNMFEKPKTKAVDLADFFNSLTRLIGADVRNKDISISVDILPEARWARVDARALQHVAMNLLANAMDALEGRPVKTLKITGEAVGEVVLLSIADSGCGMSPDLLKDIFKPFYTTKPHGTGLGMVISKKMLAQMNCGIEISSQEGVGTTVTLTLPRCDPPAGVSQDPAVRYS